MNYAALAASDGNGEPVRATVQINRSIGGATFTVDDTTHWPTGTFIATTGTLLGTGKLDPTTVQVFYGTASGTTITISSFAPGYSDLGSKQGDVVVIKPSTEWANIVDTTLVDLAQGWIATNESWTYASSTTINVPSDATTKYDIGDYIKLTQSSTVKYFVVTAVTSTLLTVSSPTGDTVANSAITANSYSKARNPHGIGLNGAISFNPYKFFAYNNAVQNVANNSKLAFNTKVYDTGNNFDAVTNNYFTAPIAGFYFFGASIYVQSAGTFNIGGVFMKNVSTQITRFGFTAVQGSGNDQQISGFVSAQLAANDTVQVNYLGSATRNVYGSSGDQVTCFTGYLVSAL